MKKLGIVALVIAVLLAGVWMAKGMIAQSALTAGIKAITGLETKVQGVSVGIFNTLVGINGLKIMNPQGFSDRLMADIPEIFVNYDLGAFLKQKVHLPELRLNLKELLVVRGPDGKVNIDSLKPLLPKKQEKEPELAIDKFNLKVGKVAFKFYLAGKEESYEFNVNIDENYTNITNPKMLVSLILKTALAKAGIIDFKNINLNAVRNKASEIAKNIKSQIESQTLDMKKQIEETKETFEQTKDEFKKLFKID